jgi:hypothetical protein
MIDREEQIREYLRKLQEEQRKEVLATRDADWQENMPIMDALARAERELIGETTGDNLSPIGMFEPIEVSLNQSISQPVEEIPYTPPAPPSPEDVTPTLPVLSTLPEIDEPAFESQQGIPGLDGSSFNLQLDTTTSPLDAIPVVAPVSQQPAPQSETFRQLEPLNRPSKPTRSQETIQSKRTAMRERAGLDPKPTKPSGAQAGDTPEFNTPTRTLPFLQGGAFPQQPSGLAGDGSIPEHDIAEQASFAADTMEMTTLMTAETLERIVSALLKLQMQLNNINDVLERSFNS